MEPARNAVEAVEDAIEPVSVHWVSMVDGVDGGNAASFAHSQFIVLSAASVRVRACWLFSARFLGLICKRIPFCLYRQMATMAWR